MTTKISLNSISNPLMFAAPLSSDASMAAERCVNWRANPQSQIVKAHKDDVCSLRRLNDGTLASSTLTGREIKLWSPDSLTEVTDRTLVRLSKGLFKIVGRDGKCIDLVASDASRFVRLKNGNIVRIHGIDGSDVEFWTSKGELIRSNKYTRDIITFMEREDGCFVVGFTENLVNLWNPEGQSCCAPGSFGGRVTDLVDLRDGSWASASEDGVLREGKDLRCLRKYEGHTHAVTKVVELNSGNLASASEDKTVKIWNRDGVCLHTLTGHEAAVNTLIKLHDGTFVSMSCLQYPSFGSMIKFWNEQGDCLHTLVVKEQEISNLTEVAEGVLAGATRVDRTDWIRPDIQDRLGKLYFWTFPVC